MTSRDCVGVTFIYDRRNVINPCYHIIIILVKHNTYTLRVSTDAVRVKMVATPVVILISLTFMLCFSKVVTCNMLICVCLFFI